MSASRQRLYKMLTKFMCVDFCRGTHAEILIDGNLNDPFVFRAYSVIHKLRSKVVVCFKDC